MDFSIEKWDCGFCTSSGWEFWTAEKFPFSNASICSTNCSRFFWALGTRPMSTCTLPYSTYCTQWRTSSATRCSSTSSSSAASCSHSRASYAPTAHLSLCCFQRLPLLPTARPNARCSRRRADASAAPAAARRASTPEAAHRKGSPAAPLPTVQRTRRELSASDAPVSLLIERACEPNTLHGASLPSTADSTIRRRTARKLLKSVVARCQRVSSRPSETEPSNEWMTADQPSPKRQITVST